MALRGAIWEQNIWYCPQILPHNTIVGKVGTSHPMSFGKAHSTQREMMTSNVSYSLTVLTSTLKLSTIDLKANNTVFYYVLGLGSSSWG